MKNTLKLRFLAAALLLGGGAALSSCAAVEDIRAELTEESRESPEYWSAQRRVKIALSTAEEKGHDEVIRLINEEKFLWDGEEYVFVIDAVTETIKAHPVSPFLIGVRVASLADGSLTVLLLADADGKWVEYEWLNPETSNVEPKTSWVKLSGRYIYGSGVYLEE